MKSLVLVITLASCLVVAQTTAKKAKKAIVAKTTTTAPAVTAPTVAIPATTPAVAMPTAPTANETAATVPADIKNGDLKSIDQEITNAKMRAELGANKKYSFGASLGYNGGTIERPFAELRPPIRAGLTAATSPATLAGTLSGKYKINTNNSLSLSTGVSIVTPFHGSYEGNKMANPVKTSAKTEVDRFAVADPSLSYTHARKIGDLQSISSAGLSYYTNSVSVDDLGAIGDIDFTQTIAGDFSGWTAGAYVGINKTFYKSGLTADQKANESLVSMYMSPFAEYAFNDTYSFRTVMNYFSWDIAANGGQGSATASNPQQSMGLGMAITRDIYVYPNVQFMPFNVRSDLTNVGLSTTFNL